MTAAARRVSPPWAAGLAWALVGLTLVGLAATLWLDRLLIRAGMAQLTYLLGSGNLILVVAALTAATVGAVVVGRQPRHRVGWLLILLGLAVAASGFTFSYTRYGLVARPGALPAANWLAGFANGGVFTYLSCVGFVLLLTPPGRCPRPAGAGGPGPRRPGWWWPS